MSETEGEIRTDRDPALSASKGREADGAPEERASVKNKDEGSYRPHRKPAPHTNAPLADHSGPLLQIDLPAIVSNWRALGALVGAASREACAEKTAAVVKADAYGCRARRVAPALYEAGCRTFFVATLDEGLRMGAELGPEAEIYVLNGFSGAEGWPEDARLRPVLNTFAEARAWDVRRRAGPGAADGKAALQLETGMNRLGLTAAEQAALSAGALEPGAVTLILTHLASAKTTADPRLISQKQTFEEALTPLLERFPAARRSLCATGGALLGPEYAYDLIRPGVGLYGGAAFSGVRPVVSLSAPILRVWEVEPGARSGYDGAWTAQRPSRLAVIPLGYADGLPRSLEGRWRARLGQGEAPLAGRISMDLIVLDVTNLDPAPKVGERAWLLDDVLTVDAMAEAAGTISYEIFTGLDAARRLERRLNSV